MPTDTAQRKLPAQVEGMFAIGAEVIVCRKVVRARRNDLYGIVSYWENRMDVTLGMIGQVTKADKIGYSVQLRNGSTWIYPSSALRLAQHMPEEFAVGQAVYMTNIPYYDRKTGSSPGVRGWSSSWTPVMDKFLGKRGVVTADNGDSGYVIRFDAGGEDYFCCPSTSLCLDDGTFEEANDVSQVNKPTTTAAAVTPAPKKKRVRVPKDGPWNAAPCAHLRWHLIGFFRDKLALVKTKMVVDGKEVEVKQVDVACTKCKTKMTLQAK